MPIVVPSPQPWVDPQNLASYLDRPVDDAQGEQILRLAASAIKAELGWDPIASVRTVSLPRVWPGRSVTLAAPADTIGDVTVAVAGSVMATGAWWIWPVAGVITFLAGASDVTITYAAGWVADELPEPIMLAFLDEAVRRLDNPRGLKRFGWTVGSEEESTFYGTAGSDLSTDHRLDPYRVLPGVG